MQRVILSDASRIILIEKIGKLEILHKFFGGMTTIGEVAEEYRLPLQPCTELKELSVYHKNLN